jgi:hypothetical protein
MADNWPTDEELVMFSREASEHVRAWKFIGGLSRTWAAERRERIKEARALKIEEYVVRIRALEEKGIKQKAALRRLDECRAFESETERLLVGTLQQIADGNADTYTRLLAAEMLTEYATRKGPRPVVEEELS